LKCITQNKSTAKRIDRTKAAEGRRTPRRWRAIRPTPASLTATVFLKPPSSRLPSNNLPGINVQILMLFLIAGVRQKYKIPNLRRAAFWQTSDSDRALPRGENLNTTGH
jgi:hypothetical protein